MTLASSELMLLGGEKIVALKQFRSLLQLIEIKCLFGGQGCWEEWVFYPDPVTKAISLQVSQPCEQMPYEEKEQCAETKAEPRTDSLHCIGDKH